MSDYISLDDLHENDDVEDIIVDPSPKLDPEPDPNDEFQLEPEEDDDPAPDPDPKKEGEEEEEEEEETEYASGVEKFLSLFNIEGGQITFEDGSTHHFNDLTPKEQFIVLRNLAETARPTVEQEFDLDEYEIGLINSIRKSNKPVNEAINDLVNERVESILAMRESTSEDFNEMPDDAIYMRWLLQNNPTSTEEDLEHDLEAAKKAKSYLAQVSNIRTGMIKTQEAAIAQKNAEARNKSFQELEQDRAEIVGVVKNMTDVAGYELDDAIKNDILQDILEVNSAGDSIFLEKTFSDPAVLFKTAWLSKYGEDYINQLSDYYKQRITEAYRRGVEETKNGMPSRPIAGMRKDAKAAPAKPKAAVYSDDDDRLVTLDELHDTD